MGDQYHHHHCHHQLVAGIFGEWLDGAYATASYYDEMGSLTTACPTLTLILPISTMSSLPVLHPIRHTGTWSRPAGSDSPGKSQVFTVRKFQTFPVSGPFTFVVISDTHAQEQRFRYVADALANESGVLFILDGGDYASHDMESQWAYYYGYGDRMLANFTLYTSIGNHEYHNGTAENVSTDAYYYRNSFVYPLYYSFDCAGIRFVSLDSPDPTNPNDENPTRAHSEALAPWLKDQLDNTLYGTFVIHHHPVWTVGHASSDSALQSWETLFHTYNISAHFAGHIHTYQRFSVEGIPYFVVANAGGGFVSLTGKPRPSSYVYGATKDWDISRSPWTRRITRLGRMSTLFARSLITIPRREPLSARPVLPTLLRFPSKDRPYGRSARPGELFKYPGRYQCCISR